MKKLLNVIVLSVFVMTPSVSLANFTGKTLKTFKTSADTPNPPIIKPGSLIPAVSTPCYAIDEVSDGDLNRLLAVAFFFGSGAGADTTPAENAAALKTAYMATFLVNQGFVSDAVFAFLKIQLRVDYNCN